MGGLVRDRAVYIAHDYALAQNYIAVIFDLRVYTDRKKEMFLSDFFFSTFEVLDKIRTELAFLRGGGRLFFKSQKTRERVSATAQLHHLINIQVVFLLFD